MVVAPEYAGFVFGTELLIWVAIGGRGTLIGPVVGTQAARLLRSMLDRRLNCPGTTSAGRWFDAAAGAIDDLPPDLPRRDIEIISLQAELAFRQFRDEDADRHSGFAPTGEYFDRRD